MKLRFQNHVVGAGWVFVNRKSTIVNDAYADSRFHKEVDEMTDFKTRNLVCTPLLDANDNCLGTLQSCCQWCKLDRLLKLLQDIYKRNFKITLTSVVLINADKTILLFDRPFSLTMG